MMAIRSRVRICYTVDSLYAGGAERYVSLLARGLDRTVFEPFVLGRACVGLDQWCAELEDAGVTVIRAPMNLPFRPTHSIKLLRYLYSLAPNLVHVNVPGPYDGQMGLLVPLARMAGASRVLVTEHLPRVERLWKRALLKGFSYRWLDGALTVCKANVEPLAGKQGVPNEKIRVVYNGLPVAYGTRRANVRESARRRLGLDPSTVALVFVGSLIERKGIATLFEALAGLDAAEWRLFVVGTSDGGDTGDRKPDSGIRDRVRFLGALSPSEVESTLCAMDMMVVPSFMEGMPYVILEAMACSLAVVASRVDGIPEAACDETTALLVPPGDPEALRGALRRLTVNTELRDLLGRQGRERFEALFTLDRHVAHMQRFYLEMLGG
ncbi:MAG: glycosyltransferase family 4 protein [Candidatus Latescibacterota bacterium]|nr:MAG: glycosyltransferase family 4 protein [Candidatus Latescibacterota bacterium]